MACNGIEFKPLLKYRYIIVPYVFFFLFYLIICEYLGAPLEKKRTMTQHLATCTTRHCFIVAAPIKSQKDKNQVRRGSRNRPGYHHPGYIFVLVICKRQAGFLFYKGHEYENENIATICTTDVGSYHFLSQYDVAAPPKQIFYFHAHPFFFFLFDASIRISKTLLVFEFYVMTNTLYFILH